MQPPTGNVSGDPVTVSVVATDNSGTGIQLVNFYWYKYQGATGPYYDRQFIDSQDTPVGDVYSISWALPTCAEYDNPAGSQKVQIEAVAIANCGGTTVALGDDRKLNGRGC